MAYPVYITTRQISVGGAMVLESSELLRLEVTISASRSLIWEATGYRFESVQKKEISNEGSEVIIAVPVTDKAGWKDAKTGAVISMTGDDPASHKYTARVNVLTVGNNQPINTYTIGPFVLPEGDGSVIDLDTMVPTSTTDGQLVLIPDEWTNRIGNLSELETENKTSVVAAINETLVTGGGSGGGSWSTLSGKPAVIAAGATQAEARTAIAAQSAGSYEVSGAASSAVAAHEAAPDPHPQYLTIVEGNSAYASIEQGTDQRVPTDSSVTNAKVSGSAAINADKLADGTTNKILTATERTKLAGIATGATANDTDANLKNRANHSGSQAISTVTNLQASLDAKAPLASPTFTGTPTGITKTHVGLSNVDNTSDVNKPVSTAQQAALDAKLTATATLTQAASLLTGIAANLGMALVIPYATAVGLGTRPTVPVGWIIIIIGGSTADADPAWMLSNDFRVATTS